jgi:hypothetical protein
MDSASSAQRAEVLARPSGQEELAPRRDADRNRYRAPQPVAQVRRYAQAPDEGANQSAFEIEEPT